jgi:MraZ protein
VFLGTHAPRLDEKGRLILPAKFRDDLAEGLVITKGQDRCLYLFSTAEFAVVAEAMSRQPRERMRVLLSGAFDEVLDKQGRITIPPGLRTYAGLSRDCAVIGAGRRVEIWDAEVWQRYLAEQEQAYAELSEEVLPGGM